jgi:hypothetical protein
VLDGRRDGALVVWCRTRQRKYDRDRQQRDGRGQERRPMRAELRSARAPAQRSCGCGLATVDRLDEIAPELFEVADHRRSCSSWSRSAPVARG